MTPLVSAIVPVYNGERFLAAALDSALAQTFTDLEIVVCDDGSTDASGAIADRYAATHPDRIRVIHQPNGGFVASRNAAIAAARGRYLALLDCDDLWLPDHVQRAVDVLEREPAVGLVHANIERIDADDRSRGVPLRFWSGERDPFEAILLRREHVSCLTAVFRHELIDRVGAFDEQFNRLGAEDRDLWLRIANVAEVRYLDVVTARYRVHGGNISANRDRMQRARMLLIDRHCATGRGRALRARALAAVYVDLGDEQRSAGERAAALGSYARAIAHQPLALRAWKGAARTLLGAR